MHEAPVGEDIVRTSVKPEDADGNDQQTRLAWAAGFIDGDGSIGIYRNGKAKALVLILQAVQVNPVPLLELQRLFGGSIARVSGKGNRRNYQKWVVAARLAQSALERMWPYFITKGNEASIGIEFSRSRRQVSTGAPLSPAEEDAQALLRAKIMALHHETWD